MTHFGTSVVAGVHAIADGKTQVLVGRLGLHLARTTRTLATSPYYQPRPREMGKVLG